MCVDRQCRYGGLFSTHSMSINSKSRTLKSYPCQGLLDCGLYSYCYDGECKHRLEDPPALNSISISEAQPTNVRVCQRDTYYERYGMCVDGGSVGMGIRLVPRVRTSPSSTASSPELARSTGIAIHGKSVLTVNVRIVQSLMLRVC